MSINILCHQYLPPGTIWVSPDIWKLLQQQYTVEALDQQFLKLMEITTKENK